METPETSELDESLITEEAREFATQLFSRFPEFRRYAAMERTLSGEEWTLVVRVPAPSTVPQSELVVWVNDGEEPSVAFAEWHTHEDLDDSDDLLDLI